MAAFTGGVEPSMRPVVWKHLLNVYPAKMNTKDRRAYLGAKCVEYYQLRYRWQRLVKAGENTSSFYSELNYSFSCGLHEINKII